MSTRTGIIFIVGLLIIYNLLVVLIFCTSTQSTKGIAAAVDAFVMYKGIQAIYRITKTKE
jgi:hypothetical protein